MNEDAVGIIAPTAIGVGEWSRLDPDGVEYGVLLRLHLPEGLVVRTPGTTLHLTDSLVLEVQLGPLAAVELIERVSAHLDT